MQSTPETVQLKKMKPALLSFVICSMLFSCTKKDRTYTSAAMLMPCNTYDDSVTISNKITGTWKLTNATCWNSSEMPAEKNIQVSFVSNGTFTQTEKTVVTASGYWKLKSIVTNQWILDLSVPASYLNGFILFCNNRVSFADGYRDGCNSFFDKMN